MKSSGDGESRNSELPPIADPEVNVHSFGILLIEIISGKLPYSAEHGAIEKWVCLGCHLMSMCRVFDKLVIMDLAGR